MRFVLLAVLVTACQPKYEDDLYLPDAQGTCSENAQIDAPRPHLHYSPHLDANIEMQILGVPQMPGWTMVDDAGVTYEPTTAATTRTDGDVSFLTLHYELAPSRRATLTIGYFCDGTDLNLSNTTSVEFFTDLP